MEMASSSSSSSSTSHGTYVSSAQIQLRPRAAGSSSSEADDNNPTINSTTTAAPTGIELVVIREDDEKPPHHPTDSTDDADADVVAETEEETDEAVVLRNKKDAPSPLANAGLRFAELPPSQTATTSFSTTSADDGTTYPLLPSSSSSSSKAKARKERKRWSAVEDADSHSGFRSTLKRVMGCGSSLDAMYEDPMPIVVFGATGLVGGAVARALLRDRRFEVKAVTRTPTTDAARKLAEEGAIIVSADLNDPRSLTRALEGAHAVFLITHYWEHMNKEKEITQGKNCVDAAVSAGVGHFVFYGSDSPSDVTGGQCAFMESKAVIEKHLKNTNLPYTVIRVPFYFENFLGVFKPHKVRAGVFAIALPMEEKALEMMAVQDVGRCVLRILLKPKPFLCHVLPLGAEHHTVQQITDVFNKHFTDRKFISPKIRVKDYESFGFDGSKDIAAMFEFYQHGGSEARDPKLARKLHGSLISFDRWVADNNQTLAENMDAA